MVAPSQTRFDRIAADLHEQGWSVDPSFLSAEEAAALRGRAEAWWDEGQFRRAGVGRGEGRRVMDEVRSDHVRWLDFSTGGRFTDVHDALYEPLRLALNQRLYLGLFDLEAHVTVYPPGAYYVRHLDRFRDDDHRWVSAILYLNEGWREEDGGALRLYLPTPDGGEVVRDVQPEAGTLVTFLSGDLWHEVRPTRRDRLSLTGWFCRRR